jgi:membrane protein YqaA with SNARE-associated domain
MNMGVLRGIMPRRREGVEKLGAFVGANLGGMLDWWLGSLLGDMTGILLAILGTAAGLYYGRKWAQDFLDG